MPGPLLPTLIAAALLLAGGAFAQKPETQGGGPKGGVQGTPPAGTATAELPLQRGFYVGTDTPCGNASNATLSLLRRDGIGGSRYFCHFDAVAPAGPNRYRVTQNCAETGAPPEISTRIYIIRDRTAFRTESESGAAGPSWRYCAQRSLPSPWRNNDIRDLIR